jgi:polyhydroxyalkanoate synthesis repressor PhaR
LATAKKTNPNNGAGHASSADKPKVALRIIKKYPNRRLYDTTSSAYITLAEVKQLVIDAKPFAVKDAKTSDDLTRSILLQIILEEELGGVPMFSEAALANMIRFYGHTMQGFMGTMLEKNMQVFMDMQSQLGTAANMPNLSGMSNMSQLMGGFMEQSQAMATQMQKQMQEQMLSAFGVKR